MRTKKSIGQNIIFSVVFIVFLLYSISLLYTFVYAFLNSLKTVPEYNKNPLGMPATWLFSNYKKAFEELSVEDTGFWMMTFNSLWWAGGHVIIHMLVVSLFSYVMSKFRFWGRKILWGLNLAIIMIPIYGNMAATYTLYSQYGLLNSPLILLAATAGFGSTTLILVAFFNGISWTYAEAAMIDGANHFTIFFKIMLPQAIPCVAAIGLVQFISTWNDYMGPLLYMDNMPTLSSGLYLYQVYAVERKGNYPIYFAGLLMSMLPVLVLYTCFSKTIMTNMGIGGVKG